MDPYLMIAIVDETLVRTGWTAFNAPTPGIALAVARLQIARYENERSLERIADLCGAVMAAIRNVETEGM